MKTKMLFFRFTSLTLTLTMLLAPFTAIVGAAPPSDTNQPPFLDILPAWAQLPPVKPETLPPAPPELEQEQIPPPRIETASDAAFAKIEPSLRDLAQPGGDEQVLVLVITHTDDADLSPYGEIINNREVEQLDARHVFMRVPARNLIKLASHPTVMAVTGYQSQPRPDLPALDQTFVERLHTVRQEERSDSRNPTAPSAPAAPESWFENDFQGVNQTWNTLNVYGTGDVGNNLKIGIIDSGVDFANPALYNRWAVQPVGMGNPAYQGWPIAFDDRSMSDWVSNPGRLWGPGGTGNWGWYVNTQMSLSGIPGTPIINPPFTDPADPSLTYTVVAVPSISGQFFFGYHPDPVWTAPSGFGYPSPVGLVVADPNVAGRYDTVCVDLDRNGFLETCMDQNPPAGLGTFGPVGGLDTTGDMQWDLSAGMVYWIDDGTNPPPASDWLYGVPVPNPFTQGPGTLVAFMIDSAWEPNGMQGTLAASTAAGYDNNQLVDWKGVTYPSYGGQSLIQGPGSGGAASVTTPTLGARIVAIGNHYAGANVYNEYLFTVFGYDGVPSVVLPPYGDDPAIVTIPYTNGYEDADAWGFESEYLAAINLFFEGDLAIIERSPIYVNAVGDGGHGYGTVSSPSPDTGVHVGASTQYGPYYYRYPTPEGWGDYEGVSFGGRSNTQDVAPFSNRGPTAMSTLAPHVVANGSQGSGALPLNTTHQWIPGGDGTTAWQVWSGSARGMAVTAGILALIYDGYWQGTLVPGPPMFPSWRQGREILMNGARATATSFWPSDLHYDEKVGGAGQVNAYRSTGAALGRFGVYVDPPLYDAGFFPPGSGRRIESFAHGLYPGQTDVTTFTVNNPNPFPVGVEIWDEQLQEINRYTRTIVTLPNDPVPSNYAYGVPDYLLDLTPLIQQNAGADLMVARVAYPFEHFAPDPYNPPNYTNRWVGAIYNVFGDGDGTWWSDTLIPNGRVEITQTGAFTTELDRDDEFIRVSYSELAGTMQEMRMRDPLERSAWWLDGVLTGGPPESGTWLGLSHVVNDGSPTTHTVEIVFYDENDWEQVSVVPIALTVPPGIPPMPGRAVFTATVAAVTMGTDIFTDDFESGFGNWAPVGLWHHVIPGDPCSNFNSSGSSAGYHVDPACNYNTGGPNAGTLTLLQPVFLPPGMPIAQLSFWSYEETDCWGTDWWWCGGLSVDERRVEASRTGGPPWDLLWTSNSDSVENTWYRRAVDLNPYIGGPVWIRFVFNADGMGDLRAGWYIDDVRIQGPVADDAYGEHMGRIIVNDFFSHDGGMGWPDPQENVIPVQKQVWFTATVDPVIGGDPRAITPYDNGHVFGAMDWDGPNPESGDWRFYPFMIDQDVPNSSIIMVDNVWEDYPTDIDSLILAPSPSWDLSTAGGFFPPAPPYPAGWFGSYTVDDLGYGSDRQTPLGPGGRPEWMHFANVGPTHEFVTAPAAAGLHVLAHHTVLYGGEMTAVPFTTTVGMAGITPNPVELNGLTCVSCTIPLVFKSGLAFTDSLDLVTELGWFQPVVTETDIFSGTSWYYTMTLSDNFRLTLKTWEVANAEDVELILRQDGGDGAPSGDDLIVYASLGSGSDEHIIAEMLPNGLYFVEVNGVFVSGAPGRFGISIKEIKTTSGGVMSVGEFPGVIEADVPYTLTLHIDVPPEPGYWEGLLIFAFGPNDLARIEVPVRVWQGEGAKISWQDEVSVGDLITYTVVVTAASNAPTNTYVISDLIPAGTQFVNVAGAIYDPGPPATITWTGTLSDELSHTITLTARAITPTVGWQKWVNGDPWTGGISVTAETSDTIEIVDVVTATHPFTLVESWNTDELALTGHTVQGGSVVTSDGWLTWTVTGGQLVTLTKLFHVEPCTWTGTMLREDLYVGGLITNTAWVGTDWQWCPLTDTVTLLPHLQATWPITINHALPDLHIASEYIADVAAGQNVVFRLVYSNTGGYENDVWITNTFPISAPYVSSNPMAARQAPDGSWAAWSVGDIAMNDLGNIDVTVAITDGLPLSTTVEIWDGIYDHVGNLADEVTTTFHITACTPLTAITITGSTSGAPGTYTFTTSYAPPNATPSILYLWDNGDTTADSVRSLGIGTHTLVVTATDCSSAQVTDTHIITIECVPITSVDYDWTPYYPDAGEVVTFSIYSLSPTTATTPITYTWDFDDGDTGSGAPVTHTYAISGSYWIQLTATNPCSEAYMGHTVDVIGEPDIGVTPLALSTALDPDDTVTAPLTVTNAATATANLNWSLAENPSVSWLSATPPTGIVAPGGDDVVSVAFDAAGMTPGVYTATLEIASNDPDESLVRVPVTLTVNCVEVSAVTLSITSTGTIYTDTVVYFSADLAPDNAAKPYNYYVSVDGMPSVVFTDTADPFVFTNTFATTGTHSVEFGAWNCSMTLPVTDVITFTVREQGVCVELDAITIAGDTSGYPGVYTFTTDYEPFDASIPITYTWDDGGHADTSVRNLDVGTYTLMVTATNSCTLPPVTDTHEIVITAAPVCTEVTGITLAYTPTGTIYTDTMVYFSADIAPDDADMPYTYTIDYGSGPTLPNIAAVDPYLFTYTFPITGTHTVTFSAWNCAMIVPESDSVSVTVSAYGGQNFIYLPIVMRNL